MARHFKTPSRRRQKKWRKRVERMGYSGPGRRGFSSWFTELLRCQPLIEAAKRGGIDLLSEIPRPVEGLTAEEVRRMAYRMICGRAYSPTEDWATRKNLEI